MGRKIDIKMIENPTRRHVTYSKRRASLIKKAHELSVFCDIDVLLLVFSPSRRASAYCSRTSLEELLERFINLPTVKKYEKNPNMKNVADKLERLKGIESIAGDDNKLHYLKNRINHLELQVKKSKIDLELLDASIRDFEPSNEEEDPIAQAKLCLRSLRNSLLKLSDRKNVLLGKSPCLLNGESSTGDILGNYGDMRKLSEKEPDEDLLLACNFGGVELSERRQNRSTTGLIRQLDPWLSPLSNKAREKILEGARVQVGNKGNALSRLSQQPDVPTFPSLPPSLSPPQKNFPALLQTQSRREKNSYELPPPRRPPYDQTQRERTRDMPFWRELQKQSNWMTASPPARYNQQHGALAAPFMSFSNRYNGEGSSSSQFLTSRGDQGILKIADYTVHSSQPPPPNQQINKNQNNMVGELSSPFLPNTGGNVNIFIGENGNITSTQSFNPRRILSLGTNDPFTSAPTASRNYSSPLVFHVNDDSSDLIGEIISKHQLRINNEHVGEVPRVNDNATVDGHVGDFLLQHQSEPNGKSNNNSNEVSGGNEKNSSSDIDDILAINDFDNELISLDDLFDQIENMTDENEGNEDIGSADWDGFALAQSLNSGDFNMID